MRTSKLFARNPGAKRTIIFAYSLLFLMVSLLIVVLIVEKRFFELLYIPLFFIVPAIIFFIIRKRMFGKIRLNDNGVAFTYKEQVLKEIKWQEIKRIILRGRMIIFLKTEKIMKGFNYLSDLKNHLAFEILYASFIDELNNYLSKLNFEIDTDLLKKLDKLKAKVFFKMPN